MIGIEEMKEELPVEQQTFEVVISFSLGLDSIVEGFGFFIYSLYRSISSFFVPDPESPKSFKAARILEIGSVEMSISDMTNTILTLIL